MRRYGVQTTHQRLHQQAFRDRVMRAYREHCAVCRLRHAELLDAAHIIPDSDPEGEPRVSNGLSLCKLHHAAFDQKLFGIRPDLIVEVRSSSNKPFAAVIDHRHEYPIRRGRHRDWLDEATIDRLYRARHQRASEVEDRIDGLARRAGEQGGDFEHPRAFIAAAPTDPLGRVFRADTPTMRGLPTPSYMFGQVPVIEPQRRAGFRRIEAASSFEMRYIESAGWIEIHDDGAYLAVIPGEDSLPESNQPHAFFWAGMFVAQFLARLSGLRALADHFDLQTEYDLAAGITAANLPAFLVSDSPDLSAPQDVRALTEPVTTHISIQLPTDLNVLDPFLVTAKSLLDDLFTAFGWAGCPQITDEGTLIPSAFGGGRSQMVSRWVESQQPHDDEEP